MGGAEPGAELVSGIRHGGLAPQGTSRRSSLLDEFIAVDAADDRIGGGAAAVSLYDFPAQHWTHIRTTNPIERTFATVRQRHDRTKGNGSKKACLAMVFKLAEEARKTWRKLNGHALISELIRGVKFVDGEAVKAA